MQSEWIEENYKDLQKLSIKLKANLFSGESRFQKVEIFDSQSHGKVLLNDGCFMLSERDEHIYHEMIAHVPLFVHPNPKKVLVIGGGDGGTAREVLRHESVEKCVMVEIDELVVKACKDHLPQTAHVFSNPRLNLRIEDGVKFMAEASEQFDVIIIDSTDPNGMAQPLFGREFYQDVNSRLAPGGIVVAQGESVFYEAEVQAELLKIAASQFAYSTYYNFSNLTYPGGLWSFLWASQSRRPTDAPRANSSLPMHYYNSDIHKAAFSLPEFQRQVLSPWIKI